MYATLLLLHLLDLDITIIAFLYISYLIIKTYLTYLVRFLRNVKYPTDRYFYAFELLQ